MRAKPDEGETITYKTQERGMIVVFALKGDTIFYRKSVLSCGSTVWNDLSIAYPAAEKAR